MNANQFAAALEARIRRIVRDEMDKQSRTVTINLEELKKPLLILSSDSDINSTTREEIARVLIELVRGTEVNLSAEPDEPEGRGHCKLAECAKYGCGHSSCIHPKCQSS
jgi:hypothetical protein